MPFFDLTATSLLSPIGAGITGLINAHNTNVQNRNQYKLMQYQNSWSEKMWNLQNQYNSPEAVMQRYRDAGINPNAIVGQVTGGMASNPTTPSSPTLHAPAMPDFGQSMAQAVALAQQNRGVEAETKLKQQQADYVKLLGLKTIAEIPGVDLDNDTKKLINEFLQRTMDIRIEGLELENQKTAADIGVLEEQKKLCFATTTETYKKIDMYNQSIEKMQVDIDNSKQITKAQVELATKQGIAALVNAYANKRAADAAWVNAQTNWSESQKRQALLEKQAEQAEALKKQIEAYTDGIILKNRLNKMTLGTQVELVNQSLFNAISTGNYTDQMTAVSRLLMWSQYDKASADGTFAMPNNAMNIVNGLGDLMPNINTTNNTRFIGTQENYFGQ